MKLKLLVCLCMMSLSKIYTQEYTPPINLDEISLNLTPVDKLKSIFLSKGLDRQNDISIEPIIPEESIFIESMLIVGAVTNEERLVDSHDEPSEEVVDRIDNETEGIRVSTYSIGTDGEEGSVTFDFDSYELTEDSQEFLDYFSNLILATSPEVILVINGHTDNTGEEAYNRSLSIKRASSVMKYLISKGLKEGNITITGKGESEPKFPNDSDINKGLNRRVEFEFYNEKK